MVPSGMTAVLAKHKHGRSNRAKAQLMRQPSNTSEAFAVGTSQFLQPCCIVAFRDRCSTSLAVKQGAWK